MDINSEPTNGSRQANNSSTAPEEFFTRKMLELSPGIEQVKSPKESFKISLFADRRTASGVGGMSPSGLADRFLGVDQRGEEPWQGRLLHRHLPLPHPHRPPLLRTLTGWSHGWNSLLCHSKARSSHRCSGVIIFYQCVSLFFCDAQCACVCVMYVHVCYLSLRFGQMLPCRSSSHWVPVGDR